MFFFLFENYYRSRYGEEYPVDRLTFAPPEENPHPPPHHPPSRHHNPSAPNSGQPRMYNHDFKTIRRPFTGGIVFIAFPKIFCDKVT